MDDDGQTTLPHRRFQKGPYPGHTMKGDESRMCGFKRRLCEGKEYEMRKEIMNLKYEVKMKSARI